MTRRLVLAAVAATLVLALSASAAFAGEITGNGRKLLTFEGSKWGTGLHARSFCAYSGQEDLQWFQDEGTDQVYTICWKGVVSPAVCTSGTEICWPTN